METMKLEQLIQATSGLSSRKETPVLVNGQPITEIRISILRLIEKEHRI